MGKEKAFTGANVAPDANGYTSPQVNQNQMQPNGLPQPNQLTQKTGLPYKNRLNKKELELVEEARKFLNELTTKEFSDELMRSKAYHHHKTLFNIAYEGVSELHKSVETTRPTGLHEMRQKCLDASAFLESVSKRLDFGDRDREKAKAFHASMGEYPTKKDEEEEEKEEKKTLKSKVGEIDEKGVKSLLETSLQHNKAIDEITAKLKDLTNVLTDK